MTEKAILEWFTCPRLVEDGFVVIQRGDGTLSEGYWYDGAVHDQPRKPPRPPAPWRIQRRDGSWWIEQRHTSHWEAHMCCDTGAEAIVTFDEESRR